MYNYTFSSIVNKFSDINNNIEFGEIMPGYKIAVYSPSKDEIVYDTDTTLVPADQLHVVGERSRALQLAQIAAGQATDWIEQPEWVAN